MSRVLSEVRKQKAKEGLKPSSDQVSQKLWGVFTRRERWGLSWRGWLVVATAVFFTIYILFAETHPFLAVTKRVNTNLLVIEGFVHPYAIRGGAEEFKSGSYQHIFTTGGPVAGSGGYSTDHNTAAGLGAARLHKLGIPNEVVQMVPSKVNGRDRTYSSAIALRDWLREHQMAVKSINIVTENVHARRTRLLFEEALGSEVKVGIIAIENPDYDSKHWWRYSEGVRGVVGEAVAYIYARFLFRPGFEVKR